MNPGPPGYETREVTAGLISGFLFLFVIVLFSDPLSCPSLYIFLIILL
jgi:hypothetical protein